jgi:hypothetical protein
MDVDVHEYERPFLALPMSEYKNLKDKIGLPDFHELQRIKRSR